MASASHKFRAPKGTRDWYPPDLAVRRHIEGVWRQVSINHGFEEVDGPTFEHVELYTAKSGPGIVGEIFGVFSGKDEVELAALKQTGQAPFALRPEFTPTLARMFAAQAGSLPRPTRWFCLPGFYRAERPQRGRLREFQQWNVDTLGDDSPAAEADAICVAIDAMQALGITSRDVTIKISNRRLVHEALRAMSIRDADHDAVFALLDRRDRMPADDFARQCAAIRLSPEEFTARLRVAEEAHNAVQASMETGAAPPANPSVGDAARRLMEALQARNVLRWCAWDLGVVRGLAYYTGTVFEIVAEGERAVAGGGRYDRLVELFGGPPTPAVGFAMGDVVLTNLLRDKGLLKPTEEYLPRPDAFMIAADDSAAAELPRIVASLRRQNLHVRHSAKTTHNVGKLLGDAAKARARFAVILGRELSERRVAVKDLESGEQREVELDELAMRLGEGS